MKSDAYTPCANAKLALEKLLRDWDVLRKDCTREEKAGFRALKKQGLVRLNRGVYRCPCFSSEEEFYAWFSWFELAIGIPRPSPFEMLARKVYAQRYADHDVGQQPEGN